MKVLIISDYYQPVIGYSKVHVARQLIKAGHKVRVLSSNKYFPFPDYDQTVKSILSERTRLVGYKVERGISIKRKRLIFEIFSRGLFFGIADEIKRYKPDVVIVYGVSSFSAIQTSFAKRKDGFKLVLADSHLPSELWRGNQILKKVFYFLFRLLFSGLISGAADKVIAAQDGTRYVIKKIYGIKKKVELVDLGTDLENFYFDAKKRSALREKYGLTKESFVIIYTGKFIPAKGLHILFSAFNNLCKKYKDIYFCLVGAGDESYKDKCLSKLDTCFHDNVIWVDFQSENKLYKYYSLADVAVWPLQDSTSMNDAAACSLPFIANHTLGAKTRISNDNALLYKKGEVLDLAKKIEYLYLKPARRKQMGRNGRQLAEENLSWSKIAQQYIL